MCFVSFVVPNSVGRKHKRHFFRPTDGWSVNADASCRSAAPIRESLVPCVLPLSGNVTVNDSESRATFGPPFLA